MPLAERTPHLANKKRNCEPRKNHYTDSNMGYNFEEYQFDDECDTTEPNLLYQT